MPTVIEVPVIPIEVEGGNCPNCQHDKSTHMTRKGRLGSDDYFVVCKKCGTQSRWSAW